MIKMIDGLDEFLDNDNSLEITEEALKSAFEAIEFTFEIDSVDNCNLHRFIIKQNQEELVYTSYMSKEVLWYSAYLFMLEVNADPEKVARLARQTGREYGFMSLFGEYVNRVHKMLLLEDVNEDTESRIK